VKKWIAAMLMLLLAFSCTALGEEAGFSLYVSDFSQGFDGWYPRSTGTAALESRDGALYITGRTSSWNSPGRDFDLQPGIKYQFSFQVMQNSVDSAEFMMSAAHSKMGLESYENLAKGKAPKGAWVTISGNYTPNAYDNYILYVETVGNGTLDFAIRNVRVESMEIKYDMTLPSLKEAYKDYFDFGAAVVQTEARNQKLMDFCASQFSILTPGNELKPDSVFDVNASRKLAAADETAVAVKFDAAKPLLDYCQKNGVKVHGHVLVWHSQTPDVFFREGYKSTGKYVSREVMLARLDNYIRLVMEYTDTHYPGVIVSWDVVNEAVSDGSKELRESNWTKVVGQDFVNRAFEIARKYAPEGVKLYYNDYNTPNEPKLTGICNLLDSLIAEGNIDGYGFQCHYSSNSPLPAMVRSAMDRIAKKGILLRVSELDVGISADNSINRIFQASRYKELMKIFLDYADQMEAVQVWGITDDKSWRGDEFPLLFDGRAKPKDAFHYVLDAVKEE